MDILLDTHMLLWWLAADHRLSTRAHRLIADPANSLVVSAASAWEVAIKQALGKLTLEADLEQAVRGEGFTLLPVTFRHAAELLDLPPIHRDPFDRMLVAQARAENLALLSTDQRISRYPVNVIRG